MFSNLLKRRRHNTAMVFINSQQMSRSPGKGTFPSRVIKQSSDQKLNPQSRLILEDVRGLLYHLETYQVYGNPEIVDHVIQQTYHLLNKYK